MPPTLILIRHAQGIHNTYADDRTYPFNDPPLTALGYTQCAELSQHLQASVPIAQQAELIVVSPMQRTLQTASLGLDFLLSRKIPAIALAELQEIEDSLCDTGAAKTVEELKREWPRFDWEELDPCWPRKEGLFAYSKESVEERGRWVKRWLYARQEKVVVVVSHAAFLRTGVCNRRFGNGDFRIFDFVEGGENVATEGGLKLREWDATDGNGGLGRSPAGFFGWFAREERTFAERADDAKAKVKESL